MTNAPLQTYFQAIERLFKAGNATEHSYRPALKDLLENLITGITATNEPRRVKCGAPDYMIERGGLTLGYVEAKDVDASLDKIEQDEQLVRYRRALSNLVLTDYLEFRWYVEGESGLAERQMSARLATTKPGGKLVFDPEGAEKVGELLTCFLEHKAVDITRPEELAQRMARLTHMIREVIVLEFQEHEASDTLRDQLIAFDRTLLPGITTDEFADMFAQTIAYGLFAARHNHTAPQPFTRYDATREIPKTNPFLKKLFEMINSSDLDDEPFVGFVDELAQVLATTRMDEVLAKFGKRTRQEDPIIHFYETFLSQYDPQLRELRGVYYTPSPVISYMVRSVDYLLKEEFGIVDGLADAETLDYTSTDADGHEHTEKIPRVLILDPACGTGTFLSSIIEYIRENHRTSHSADLWSQYVRDALLPRLFGFELLMAPYAMAHLRLGMQLAGLDLPPEQRAPWKYDFKHKERLGVYLTNTLTAGLKQIETLLLAKYISDEANEAASIKRQSPVMVIIGNPPYSGHSANKGDWIRDLLHGKEEGKGSRSSNYFEVDGQPLQERNPKWLNDDYVKFIRFAQWRLEQTGYGVLAFITNHGYLDNPTFRGMRQSLMQTFDEIYVLNLHGNSKKQERSPDGSKDENIFDIRQGVAISIFIKRKDSVSGTKIVHYADLWGKREGFQGKGEQRQLVAGKYYWLGENDLTTTDWKKLTPQSPSYLFIQLDSTLQAEYQKGWKVTDMFSKYASTITSGRNELLIALSEEEMKSRMKDFINPQISSSTLKEQYFLGVFNVDASRSAARSDNDFKSRFRKICFRPFDTRYTFYANYITERSRLDIMKHMFYNNLALLTHRPQSPGKFTYVFCTSLIADQCVAANKLTGGGNSFQFPIYLYPESTNGTIFDNRNSLSDTSNRLPNYSQAFITDISQKLNMTFIPNETGDLQTTFGPEDIFHYMYAIFHAPSYRERYAEFLKIDFPRLPLTSNVELFRALCAHGQRLVELHLLKKVSRGTVGFQGQGNYTVEKVEYIPRADQPEMGGVWINKTQHFVEVPAQVWEFHIGGYQVCHKWLKDRKGRTLALLEFYEYQKIVTAISETITLMEKIDEVIEEYGGWPIE
jgi:predicted helicase